MRFLCQFMKVILSIRTCFNVIISVSLLHAGLERIATSKIMNKINGTVMALILFACNI